MKRKNGFTLVELLVVVAIIALLVTILLPTLGRAKEVTRRAVCGSNLTGIGKGIILYATSENNAMPYSGQKISSGAYYYAQPGTHEREYRQGSNNCSNTRNLYLLLRLGICNNGSFICPSLDSAHEDSYDTVDHYDFKNIHSISYAYQNQGLNTSSEKGFPTTLESDFGLAIAADANPLLSFTDAAGGGDDGVYSQGARSDVSNLKSNSLTHDGDGQNVLYLSCSAKWTNEPTVGIDKDNIWTMDKSGNSTAPDATGDYPATEKDSFLVR